ncbi:MAG: nitrite reductase small subunit NirD [Ignavibacteria bacterium]|nr:nitrite reductase small subunit NirD [Ignavibacteria bacterium]
MFSLSYRLTEDNYQYACSYSELKEKSGKRIFVDDEEIAVFKVEGNVYAFSNICPHQKTHLMHEGFVEDRKLFCPVHGWSFDLQTGNISPIRKGLTTYPVKIVDGDIYIKISKKEFNW